MMMKYLMEARCDSGHTQEFWVRGATRPMAVDYAALLEGSHSALVARAPGMCKDCGAPFRVQLVREEPDDSPPDEVQVQLTPPYERVE